MEEAARTEPDYLDVLDEWDRLDRNRTRRNQRHEFLRGDVPAKMKKLTILRRETADSLKALGVTFSLF